MNKDLESILTPEIRVGKILYNLWKDRLKQVESAEQYEYVYKLLKLFANEVKKYLDGNIKEGD